MPFKTIACLVAAAVMLASCASNSAVTATSLPPPDRAALATEGSALEYRIGPLDVLDVAVFQVPELTRTVTVDAMGNITLPLLGQAPAAGRTTVELQDELAGKLRAKYLQSPEVSITVKEFTSQRVTIDGAVTQPGVYPIRGRTTLMQAVAQARGATALANQKEVVVFRTVNGQKMGARFDLNAIRDGKAEDPEVYGNDVIIVDRSGSRSILREFIGVLPLYRVFQPLIF